jgi:hypothetical protein
MEGPKITVKGETDLHTLAVIYPAHDTHFGMSVGDVINLVAGKNGFSNLNQLGLKTINGLELKRGIFLEFKLSPVVHLFTLKGREKSKLQQIFVFRYRDGGPFMKIQLPEDKIDLSELLYEACINFSLEIENYELYEYEDKPFEFYLHYVHFKSERPTYEFEKFNMRK